MEAIIEFRRIIDVVSVCHLCRSKVRNLPVVSRCIYRVYCSPKMSAVSRTTSWVIETGHPKWQLAFYPIMTQLTDRANALHIDVLPSIGPRLLDTYLWSRIEAEYNVILTSQENVAAM